MTAPSPTPQDHPVAPTTGRPMLILWSILLVTTEVPLALMLGNNGLAYLASVRAWLGPVLVSLSGVAVSLAYLRRGITLDDARLTIRSTFYTRTVAVGSLRLEGARIVDLAEHGELKPALKTNGYSLPGFRSGHYRMRDGGKVFCLITDHSRVLSLPLRDGSRLLISPEQPRTLLAALERRAGKPAP